MFSFMSVTMVEVSPLRNRNWTATEIVIKDLGVNVRGLAMFFLGGLWALRVWIRKAGECFKQNLQCHSSRSMKNEGTRVIWTVEVWLKTLQRRMSVCGRLENDLVIFWQRRWLLFSLVWKDSLRLNWTVLYLFCWWRRSPHSLLMTLVGFIISVHPYGDTNEKEQAEQGKFKVYIWWKRENREREWS